MRMRAVLCLCIAAIPAAAGTDPTRVMFPFRLPDNVKVGAKKSKAASTGKTGFQHVCFDFVYAVAKTMSEQNSQIMSEHIDALCTMSSPENCKKWSGELAQVMEQKKSKTKVKGSATSPRTYSQWCNEVYSTPESAKALHIMGDEKQVEKVEQPKHMEEQPKHRVEQQRHQVEEPKHQVEQQPVKKHKVEPLKSQAEPHHDEPKAFLHHQKETVSKQSTETTKSTKLQDCMCNTREGHETCRCEGGIQTVDGVVQMPHFSAASVATNVEGYEIAQKFRASNLRLAGSLDSAIDSLDVAFSASHRLMK